MKLKIFFACIFITASVLAQGTSRGSANLKLPSTPLVGATGEAFVADSKSLQSISLNPANVAGTEYYSVLFSHTSWIQDIRTEYLSIAAPFNFGVLAFSVANTSVDGIELRTIPGPPVGSFNSQASVFQLNYGVAIADNVLIGIAPKYLYEKIFVDDATGWGVDIGTLYTPPIENLTVGLSLTNLGSLSAFRENKSDLPSQMHIGATYSFSMNEFSFRTAASFSSEFGISVHHLSLGGEATFDPLTIRLGYKTGYEYRGFSAGIGIRYALVVLDYAFLPSSAEMGNSHIISLGFIL